VSEDELLVRKCKGGDLDAFDELVRRYQSKVYTVAFRFMGNHADAGDLAQEAFIRVFQALASFRGDSSFATWIYRIASNVCRDELRKQQRQKKVSLDEMIAYGGVSPLLVDGDPSPQEQLERSELKDQVQRHLNELSGDHRLILVMRDIQGMPYDEIASALDCSVGTIKSRLSRARQALKRKILDKRELYKDEIRLPGR